MWARHPCGRDSGRPERHASPDRSCSRGVDEPLHRDVRTDHGNVPRFASSDELGAFVKRDGRQPSVAPHKAAAMQPDVLNRGRQDRRPDPLASPILGRCHPSKPPRRPSKLRRPRWRLSLHERGTDHVSIVDRREVRRIGVVTDWHGELVERVVRSKHTLTQRKRLRGGATLDPYGHRTTVERGAVPHEPPTATPLPP
jgi:hypothetical protein